MTTDPSGIYTLPPQTWVQTGDTVLPEQHNPAMLDIEQGMTDRLMRDGRAPMTGDLAMGGNKITGLADPAAAQDAATKSYVDGVISGGFGTAATVDHGTAPGEVPLNSDLSAAEVPMAGKASTLEAQAGVDNTKWMTPAKVADVALGMGQEWAYLSGSRTGGTIYQNTTGRAIFVTIHGRSSDSNIRFIYVSVDGTTWENIAVIAPSAGTGDGYYVRTGTSFVVPSNHYYQVTGALGSAFTWSELR